MSAEPATSPPRPLVVAVEGIDGAGKTHVARLLAERLRARGYRIGILDRRHARFGNAFADSRLDLLRAAIWPQEPEPAEDVLGTHFSLFLLAAWFAALNRLVMAAPQPCDVLVTDGTYFRVVAKAHLRSGLPIEWLLSLFENALQPDCIALLDVDPAQAWGRRPSFKATEVGRWDGLSGDPEQAFIRYQGKVRRVLLTLAAERDWTVVRQSASSDPESVCSAVEESLRARLTPGSTAR